MQQVGPRGIRLHLSFQHHGVEFHYLILDGFQFSLLYVAPKKKQKNKETFSIFFYWDQLLYT